MSGTSEIITKKSLCHWKPRKSEERMMCRKTFEEIMDPRFVERHEPTTDSEAEETQNQIKPKKSKPRHIIIKLVKTEVRESWKQPEKNITLFIGEQLFI